MDETTTDYPLQPLWNIAEVCVRHGIKNAVLSPGSRCAPLVHGFTQHPEIECYMVTDERSAGFIAMGMAQQIGQPVVLICTSGTAGVNYFSAIAEAFYQNIPLLVLTADRPPELLDQQDGQTIHQQGIYGKHVQKSLQLPDDFLHPDKIWHTERLVNEAIHACLDFPCKPVHLNIPIREPFYPSENTKVTYNKNIKIIQKEKFEQVLAQKTIQNLRKELQNTSKILIVAGQDNFNSKLCQLLNSYEVPIISDIISNTHSVQQRIRFQDFTLINSDFQAKLGKADLVISFGKSVISKNLKLFLRKYRPVQHWHIQQNGDVADTFKSLTRIIPTSALYFFKHIFQEDCSDAVRQARKKYVQLWRDADQRFEALFPDYFENQPFSEAEIVYKIVQKLPHHTVLHLANSMAVRYANVFNFMHRTGHLQEIEVYANRGVSGIDGSTSTALGHTLKSDRINLLITGDLAFFYDRNAFWNRYLPPNFRILLLNNAGGGIFKMIPGPSRISDSEHYFTTPHTYQAEFLCKEFGIDYQKCDSTLDFSLALSQFFELSASPKLLECHTDMYINSAVWSNLKREVENY